VGVVHDFADSGVDDHLGAHEAGAEGGVEGGIADAVSVVGDLGDRILLTVRAEAFVEAGSAFGERVAPGAPAFIAVSHAARGAVVAGRDDATVTRDYGRHLALDAVAPGGDDPSNRHEVFVPARSFKKKAVLQNRLELLVQRFKRAVVRDRDVREVADREELLCRPVRAAELSPFLLAQLLESLGVPCPATRLEAFQPRFDWRVDPDQREPRRTVSKRFDLRRMPNRVDDVVPVRHELVQDDFGQAAETALAANRVTGADHPIARLVDPL